MSLFVSGSAVYFGESQAADEWIRANVPGARRMAGASVAGGGEKTSVAPGVTKYGPRPETENKSRD